MQRWRKLFTEHPRSVDETYGQHFGVAAGFGLRMIGGGLACLVHAVLPFAFTRTGSNTIADLHGTLSARREAASPVPSATWSAAGRPSSERTAEVPSVLGREGG